MLAIKTINSVAPALQPLRDGYSVITSDLLSSGSGRSAETGVTMRYKVRANVYKLQLKFKGKTADVASVYAQIKDFTLTVCFYDASYAATTTEDACYPVRNFYSGDPTFTNNGETAELSVNLIEI